MKKNILVTSVGGPPGLNTLKILSEEEDYNLIGVDADKYACGLYLDNIKPYVIPMTDENNYIPVLLDICKKENIDVLIPCYESEILKISENRPLFEGLNVKIPLSSHNTVLVCCDKSKTIEQAKKAGVPHPKTYLIKEESQLENINLEFPVVLKPRFGSGARGVSYPETKSELFTNFIKLRKSHSQGVLVQELIPGGPGSVYMCGLLYDKHHRPRVSFLSRSLKVLYKNGGPAVVGEPIENKEIVQMCIKLLDSFGNFLGPAGIEFKIDERNGIPKLMEINPRLWGYSRLSFVSGINIHKMTVQVALGEEIPEMHDYNTNKLLVRMFDDKVFNKEEVLGKLNKF